MRITAATLLASLGLFLAGCGGGGSSSSQSGPGMMSVQIKWPARGRLIPQSADYVTFSVYTNPQLSTLVNSFNGTRPATTVSTTSWANGPAPYGAGTYYVQASAYANSDPVHALASGETQVVVTAGNTTNFTITLASALAQFKLSGALSGTVTLAGGVTGSPTLVVPVAGWGQAQGVTIEPEDSTGSALVLLNTGSILTVTSSSNITVSSGGIINSGDTQFTTYLTPNGMNGSSFVKIQYQDGDASGPSGLTTLTAQAPIQITPPVVTVLVEAVNAYGNLPITSNTSTGALDKVSAATLSDSGGTTYQPSSWAIGNTGVTVVYNNVTDKNLPFSASTTVQLEDEANVWHTLLTATTSTAQTIENLSPTVTELTGIVGNLSIGTSSLGSFNSGTWPTVWGVTATVGGTQAVFSPTLFGAGTPTFAAGALTGAWPTITAATLTNAGVGGSVSIPVSFSNGSGNSSTGTVTATILATTGNGSGTIN